MPARGECISLSGNSRRDLKVSDFRGKAGGVDNLLAAYIPQRLQYTVAREVRPGHPGHHPYLI